MHATRYPCSQKIDILLLSHDVLTVKKKSIRTVDVLSTDHETYSNTRVPAVGLTGPPPPLQCLLSEPPARGGSVLPCVRVLGPGLLNSSGPPTREGPELSCLHASLATTSRSSGDPILPCGLWRVT
jgi:hypothetical protein